MTSAVPKKKKEAPKITDSVFTDGVRIHLTELGKIPLLQPHEEIELGKKVKAWMPIKTKLDDGLSTAAIAESMGITEDEVKKIIKQGERAFKKMVESNLRLVVSVAKEYQNRGVELLDLIQEGSIGLQRGVQKFDWEKGYKLSTYAYWWIRQAVTRAIAQSSRTIRLPVHVTEKLNKVKKVTKKLGEDLGRHPKHSELAKALEISERDLQDLLLNNRHAVSLNTRIGRQEDTELGDLIQCQYTSESALEFAEMVELRDHIAGLLDLLNDNERAVIKLRFGIDCDRCHTLAEVGAMLNFSRERARQIEAKAKKKMRPHARKIA